jgi:hypothetical protein
MCFLTQSPLCTGSGKSHALCAIASHLMSEYAAGRRSHPVVYFPDIAMCKKFDDLKHACVFSFLNNPAALRALSAVHTGIDLGNFMVHHLNNNGVLIMDQWNKLDTWNNTTRSWTPHKLKDDLEILHAHQGSVAVVRSQSANLDNRESLLGKQANEETHAFYSRFTQLQVQAMFTNYQQLPASSSSSSSSSAAAAYASGSGSDRRVLTEDELSAVEDATGTSRDFVVSCCALCCICVLCHENLVLTTRAPHRQPGSVVERQNRWSLLL